MSLTVLAIGLFGLFIAWRVFLRTQGTWVDVPADPHELVPPRLVPLVDWLAAEAESQIGRDLPIAGDAFALAAIAEVVERALDGQVNREIVEIFIADFIGDAEGMHGR